MTGNTFFFGWEVTLMEWLQSAMGAPGVFLATLFTSLGEETILVAIFGLLYWCIDKKTAKNIGMSIIIGLIANPMIKNVALRRRPYFDHETIQCLKPVESKADLYDVSAQGFSFPSAHASNSTIMYTGLLYRWKKTVLKVAVPIILLLIGLSRIALGVHYPTDVLAGWALGLCVVVISNVLQSRIRNRNVFHLVLFVLSLAGVFYCRTNDYYTGLGLMAGFFLATPFEEKYVNFSETRKPLACVLRIVGGMAIFLGINTLLKLPFSREFLNSGTVPAYLVRTARYAIIMFIMVAIYPMAFGLADRLKKAP